jgi:hypothetical protein
MIHVVFRLGNIDFRAGSGFLDLVLFNVCLAASIGLLSFLEAKRLSSFDNTAHLLFLAVSVRHD